LKASGYSTRYAFKYTGAANVPVSTNVQLAFGRLIDSNTNIQSLWGQPLLSTITKQLAATTSPFLPSFTALP
jgi:hypothetical protein